MSQAKFGRNYILAIQIPSELGGTAASLGQQAGINADIQPNTVNNNETLIIQPPFTIEFDITRNTLTSTNIAQIRIFNLSKQNRNLIRFNRNDMGLGSFKGITLQAGYGYTPTGTYVPTNNLPIIFTGNITDAHSYREGVNYITEITSTDGGYAFANDFLSTNFPANYPIQLMLGDMVGLLSYVTKGAIGSYPGNLSRGIAVCGYTCELLREHSGQGFFIDNGSAHCLGESEYISDGDVILVNSQSGLLNTPIREETHLTFDMIFEPNMKPGRLIQLQSSTDPVFNGFRKVLGVKHRGMISTAICGEVTTNVTTNYIQDLTPVTVV